MYSIGDDDEEFEVETAKSKKDKAPPKKEDLQEEFEELNVDIEDAEEFEGEDETEDLDDEEYMNCLLYTSPSPRDLSTSRMPSSA